MTATQVNVCSLKLIGELMKLIQVDACALNFIWKLFIKSFPLP